MAPFRSKDVSPPAVETLLKWAARDNDRTMLFGHELTVTLPPRQ